MLRGSQALKRAKRPLRLSVSTCTQRKRLISYEVAVTKNRTPTFKRRIAPADVVEVPGVRSRSVYIRVWEGIGSIADLFAIITHVEKHLGRIADFTAPRDGDIRSTYAGYIHATFAHDEDVAAIPKEGKVLQVPVPDIDKTTLGGVSITTFQECLDASQRENYLNAGKMRRERKQGMPPLPDGVKVIDVKIEHADVSKQGLSQHSYISRHIPYRTRDAFRTRELAQQIVQFGRVYGGIEKASEESAAPLGQLVARWASKLPLPPAEKANDRGVLSSSEQDVQEASTSASGSGIERSGAETSERSTEDEGRISDPTLDILPSLHPPSEPHIDPSPSTLSFTTPTPTPSPIPEPTPSPAPQLPPSDKPSSPDIVAPIIGTSSLTNQPKKRTTRPVPLTTPKQATPTLSKRDRMLLAAKQAGAAEVLKQKEREKNKEEREKNKEEKEKKGKEEPLRDVDNGDAVNVDADAKYYDPASRVMDSEPKIGHIWFAFRGRGEEDPAGNGSLSEESKKAKETESAGKGRPSPQEMESMEEATSWWKKMTSFRK